MTGAGLGCWLCKGSKPVPGATKNQINWINGTWNPPKKDPSAETFTWHGKSKPHCANVNKASGTSQLFRAKKEEPAPDGPPPPLVHIPSKLPKLWRSLAVSVFGNFTKKVIGKSTKDVYQRVSYHISNVFFTLSCSMPMKRYPQLIAFQDYVLTNHELDEGTTGMYLPNARDPSFWQEVTDLTEVELDKQTSRFCHDSPIVILSADANADADVLAIRVGGFNPETGLPFNRLLRTVTPSGKDSVALCKVITGTMDEVYGDETWAAKLYGWSADGAAVNGVMRVIINPGGKNMAMLLEDHCGHRVLSLHCAAHRLQLTMKDSRLDDGFLEEIDDKILKLQGHLKGSQHAKDELFFWSTIPGDDFVLRSLGSGKA